MPNANQMTTAHRHAENAEAHRASGLLVPAAEEHIKAAEAYLASIDPNFEESTNRTLRMLHNQHHKAGLELQRKIESLKADGLDPTVPQKPDISAHTSTRSNSIWQAPATVLGPLNPSRPASPHLRLGDSQAVDESFMLLGGQRSEPGDAFNHFWDIMQGMLDNLSQPVAFATAPLGAPEIIPSDGTQTPPSGLLRRDGSLSSDTDFEESKPSRFSWRLGKSSDKKSPTKSSTVIPQPPLTEEPDDEFEEGDELSESFYLVASEDEATPQSLKKENSQLKAELESMKKRLSAAERAFEMKHQKETQLRDSILLASKEVQRAMGGVPMSGLPQRPNVDFGSLNINVPLPSPIPGYNTAREAQYGKRVKELEDELRVLRIELEKTRVDNLKHRERWAKVKESAKRRKEVKANAVAANATVRERIVEEPEAEEAEDVSRQLD